MSSERLRRLQNSQPIEYISKIEYKILETYIEPFGSLSLVTNRIVTLRTTKIFSVVIVNAL